MITTIINLACLNYDAFQRNLFSRSCNGTSAGRSRLFGLALIPYDQKRIQATISVDKLGAGVYLKREPRSGRSASKTLNLLHTTLEISSAMTMDKE